MINESELRDALLRQAETYDVPPPDVRNLRAAALRRRRDTRLRYGGMAAAALVVVSVAWGALRVGPADVQPAEGPADVTISPSCLPPGETPPVPDNPNAGDGFLSDEPVPATAPGGRSCTLVLRYWFHRFGAGRGLGRLIGISPDPGFSGMVWLYSDGQLIVDTQEDWFVQKERRLSPTGVERLRKAVVSTLDLSATRPPPTCPQIAIDASACRPGDGSFEAAVHYGERSFYPKEPGALVKLLIDRSWLSDEDWVTEDASIYRAAWYATCYEQADDGVDVQAAVSDLPSGARDVLESRVWTPIPPEAEKSVVRTHCLVLSRADATGLVTALDGDITSGKAIAFPENLPVNSWGHASPFSVHALMPDGTSGAHGD